jgi:hypothetical protein
LGLVNKLSAIALPAMMAALGGIALAFKAGTYFINMYKAAMASLASAVAVGFVALTTFLAAQKEYAAVQNSAAYFEGNGSTSDRMIAAGEAMSMFTDNTKLAVVGAKGLQSAFSTLSKVKPVTGETTAAFEGLMNIVVGSGGDIEKGSGKLAEFLAAVQKKGSLAGGASIAKELGPDFEKIVKEAGALGIKTSDEFMKAAAEGNLGETFATKYAGMLDAINNTVMGRFKGAVSSIKSLLTDLGGQYLGETGTTITRLQGIIETFIVRLGYVMKSFDTEGKMGGFLDKVEKGTNQLIVLMTKYLGATPNIFQFFNKTITSIRDVFDGMQDWMRQFREAGELINEYFFKPMFSALGQNFTRSMTDLAEVIESNKDSITSFAIQISKTLTAMGKYGDTVRRLFMGAMPVFQLIFKMVELFFRGLTAFGNAALKISGAFQKLGPLGKLAGALVNVAALYSLFTLATRFFKVFGTMFGKNMDKNRTINMQAGVVNVNGGMGTGGRPPLYPTPTGGPIRQQGRFARAGQAISGHMGGAGAMLTTAGLMMGGSYLSSKGDYDSAGGTGLKAIGNAAQIGGAGYMMLGQDGLAKLGSKSTTMGASTAGAATLAGVAAIAAGSYAAGSYIGGKFNDDSVKSRGTSALAGAASGAAIGAVIGNFIPIPLIGAGIGAALGAAIGGVTGYMKAGKQRKETRKAAKELTEGYASTVAEAMEGGNVDDLLKARDKALADRNKLVATNADPAYAAKAVAKYDKEFEALNTKINNYTGNAALAQKAFGVGAEQLNAAAKAKGINIEDELLTLRDTVKILGADTAEQARLMKAAWANIGASAVGASRDFFTQQETAAETSKLVDSSLNKLITGGANTDNMNAYLKNLRDFSVASYGDIEGLTSAGRQIEFDLTEGELKGLTDSQKQFMRDQASGAGFGGVNMLKNIDMDQVASQLSGYDALLNAGGGLGKTGKGEDPTQLDPIKLRKYLASQLEDNPDFLSNLINASQETNDVFAQNKVSQVINTGTSTGAMNPVLDAEARRWAGAYGGTAAVVPPATQPITNNNEITTNISGVLTDQKTVDQIERIIAKAVREQQERGPVTVNS